MKETILQVICLPLCCQTIATQDNQGQIPFSSFVPFGQMKGTKEGVGEPCEFLSAASAGREIFEKVVCSVGKTEHAHY